jgi:hypothetical protein
MWQGTIAPAVVWTSERDGHESVEPSPIAVGPISTICGTADMRSSSIGCCSYRVERTGFIELTV